MNKTLMTAASLTLLLSLTLTSLAARADVGLGVRAGTLGYGADLDVSLTEKLNVRLGYNYFNYNRTVDDTNVRYDGKLKISSLSGTLDWHAFGGGFRFSLGAVTGGPKIELVGTPTANTYDISGNVYTTAQIGSLTGEIKIGSSVAPYVGIGWGNVVSEKHRVSFLFDLGAIYGGTPDVKLTATCNSSLSAGACATVQTQLQTDLAKEISQLEADSNQIKWYPIINIGIGIRF